MAGGLSLPPLEWDVWLILVTLRYRANVFQRDLLFILQAVGSSPAYALNTAVFPHSLLYKHIGAACFTVLPPAC